MGRTKRIRKRKTACKTDLRESTKELYAFLYSFGWRNETQLYPKYFEETGRGLYSKKAINAGDLLVKIPLEALLTLRTIEIDKEFMELLNVSSSSREKISFQSVMSMFVLFHQHKNDSKYKSYLNTIPRRFTNPLFCSKTELCYLPESILKEAVNQLQIIKSSYEYFKLVFKELRCGCCNKLYIPDIFPLDDFKWAYFAVNTRCVYIDPKVMKNCLKEGKLEQILKDEPSIALPPLLDFFNHTDKVNTLNKYSIQCDNFKNCFYELYTSEDCKKHEQVFISYGNLNNTKLFVEYGFFLKNNRHDMFVFYISDVEGMIKWNKSLKSIVIHRNKFKFIRDHNLDDQMFVHHVDGISHNLKVVLYLIFKEESHFTNMLNQVAFGPHEYFESAIQEEVKILLDYKIAEYSDYVKGFSLLTDLSDVGKVSMNYLENCIYYLRECLNKIF